jgi:hypothetical protein
MLEFKHERDEKMLLMLNPILIMIYADLYSYTLETHGVNLIVTDTISDAARDKKLGRTSTAHKNAIAIDVRTRNLDAFVVNDMISYLNTKTAYDKYKYLSRSGERRLAYWHNSGNGEHLHIALHSKFAIPQL